MSREIAAPPRTKYVVLRSSRRCHLWILQDSGNHKVIDDVFSLNLASKITYITFSFHPYCCTPLQLTLPIPPGTNSSPDIRFIEIESLFRPCHLVESFPVQHREPCRHKGEQSNQIQRLFAKFDGR